MSAARQIDENRWAVDSFTGNGAYYVFPSEERCTCPHHVRRGAFCKHLQLVQEIVHPPQVDLATHTCTCKEFTDRRDGKRIGVLFVTCAHLQAARKAASEPPTNAYTRAAERIQDHPELPADCKTICAGCRRMLTGLTVCWQADYPYCSRCHARLVREQPPLNAYARAAERAQALDDAALWQSLERYPDGPVAGAIRIELARRANEQAQPEPKAIPEGVYALLADATPEERARALAVYGR